MTRDEDDRAEIPLTHIERELEEADQTAEDQRNGETMWFGPPGRPEWLLEQTGY